MRKRILSIPILVVLIAAILNIASPATAGATGGKGGDGCKSNFLDFGWIYGSGPFSGSLTYPEGSVGPSTVTIRVINNVGDVDNPYHNTVVTVGDQSVPVEREGQGRDYSVTVTISDISGSVPVTVSSTDGISSRVKVKGNCEFPPDPVRPSLSQQPFQDCYEVGTVVTVGEGDLSLSVDATIGNDSRGPVTLNPGESKRFSAPARNYWGQEVTISVNGTPKNGSTKGGQETIVVNDEDTCDPPRSNPMATVSFTDVCGVSTAQVDYSNGGYKVTETFIIKLNGQTVVEALVEAGQSDFDPIGFPADGEPHLIEVFTESGLLASLTVTYTECPTPDPTGDCQSLSVMVEGEIRTYMANLVGTNGAVFTNHTWTLNGVEIEGSDDGLMAIIDESILEPGSYTVQLEVDIDGTTTTVSCQETFTIEPDEPTEQPARVCVLGEGVIRTIGENSVNDLDEAGNRRYSEDLDHEACTPDTPEEVETGGLLVSNNSAQGGQAVIASAVPVNYSGLGSAFAFAVAMLVMGIGALVCTPVAFALRRI